MKIILDMDVGIDDAMALAYALASSECELLGIVGVYGNVSMETSVRNSLRLLEYFERTDIPVYKGSEQSLLATNPFEPNKVITDIHGIDGVGNTHLTTPKATAQQEDGIDYLIDMSHRYGKELCIVPTGPLTNIAKMLQRCPEVAKAIGGIVLMGGAFMVPGNVSPFAEANINNDPEAAKIVFESGVPLTIVGLDVTHQTLLTKKDTAKWRELGTEIGQNFADMVDFYINIYQINAKHLQGCPLHDPLAIAVALNPSLVKTLQSPATVITEADQRGRTILCSTPLNKDHSTPLVAVSVEVDAFVEDFNNRLIQILS